MYLALLGFFLDLRILLGFTGLNPFFIYFFLFFINSVPVKTKLSLKERFYWKKNIFKLNEQQVFFFFNSGINIGIPFKLALR